jgi:hypothetical protein
MVTESESQENRFACYDVLQAHAKVIAEKDYQQQYSEHMKKGRSLKTFRFAPSDTLNKLVQMSKDVAGTQNTFTGKVTYKITPKEVMGYLANDGEFQYRRFG